MGRPSKMRSRFSRPPRIRVPNDERALFIVDDQKCVGIVRRLSLTGGSTLLVKGALPKGTVADMVLNTVFGKVTAQIEFIHTGADGNPDVQAFRFLHMDDVSSRRFEAAAKQMQEEGFSDVQAKANVFGDLAKSFGKLRKSVQEFSDKLNAGREPRRKRRPV